MNAWWRRWWWPLCKAALAVAILVAIGIHFHGNLSQLPASDFRLRPEWLALSGGLYLVTLAGSAWFWYRLMRSFGVRPGRWDTFRGYYLGHLGKYVPGKAWAILIRANIVRNTDVRLGMAIITSFYEVFTTMASGAMVAAILFALQTPDTSELVLNPVLSGVLLLVVLVVPLLPGVFNWLVRRMARRFQNVESFRLPPVRGTTLAFGLVVTGCGWAILGVSLWAVVQAVAPEPQPLTLSDWALYTAMISLSYVAGFAAFILPSGIGVRESLLFRLLLPKLGPQWATVAALAHRVLWTAMELLVGAIIVWIPGRSAGVAQGSLQDRVGQDADPDTTAESA